jgi:hypothetical protein
MANIVIKDLKESVELDRAAMRQITGGWSRQRLSGITACEPSILRKSSFFDRINLAGFDFDPNQR